MWNCKKVILISKLDALLESKNQPLDCVVEFKIEDAILFRRICGRWFHISSGRSYHEEFYPPKVPGKDDVRLSCRVFIVYVFGENIDPWYLFWLHSCTFQIRFVCWLYIYLLTLFYVPDISSFSANRWRSCSTSWWQSGDTPNPSDRIPQADRSYHVILRKERHNEVHRCLAGKYHWLNEFLLRGLFIYPSTLCNRQTKMLQNKCVLKFYLQHNIVSCFFQFCRNMLQ